MSPRNFCYLAFFCRFKLERNIDITVSIMLFFSEIKLCNAEIHDWNAEIYSVCVIRLMIRASEIYPGI